MRHSISRLRTTALISLASASTLIWFGCSKQQGGGGFEMPPTPVEIAEVRTVTVTDRFEAVGTIEAGEAVTIVSEVSGLVVGLPFAEGQEIDSGGLIAQMDDQQIRAAFQAAEATRDQSKITFDRSKRMYDAGAVSKQDLDIAAANLKVAEAEYELARVRLSKCQVRAPFSGVAGPRMVSPGAFLLSGFSLTPITTLTQIGRLKVTFAVPERIYPLLKRGAEVAVTTPAYPEYSLSGTIDVIDPVIDSNTRSVRIIARISNKERKFRPGMSATITAILGERSNSLTIPDEAVFAEGNQAFVFSVQSDNSVLRTPIVLGTRQAGSVEVVSGLTAGAKVVRAGHQKLYPGAKVMPASAMPPGGGQPQATDSTQQPVDSGSTK
jgi:membrane fusion protein (multidrug efflux system)